MRGVNYVYFKSIVVDIGFFSAWFNMNVFLKDKPAFFSEQHLFFTYKAKLLWVLHFPPSIPSL